MPPLESGRKTSRERALNRYSMLKSRVPWGPSSGMYDVFFFLAKTYPWELFKTKLASGGRDRR